MTPLPEIGFAAALTENARNYLTTYGEYCDYPEGTEIIKQGEKDAYMYLMIDGTCEVYYRGFKGDVTVGTIKTGASFGEFSMLFNQTANANIRTTSPVKVWKIKDERFNVFEHEVPGAANTIMRELLQLMGNRLKNAGQIVVGNTITEQSDQ
ncbi:MAG: cyclic nucleotide-binding domain-containing protein [Verrucomicrobiota bacterium]